MAQRHTDRTEQILRLDAVGIPFRNRPLRDTERVFLTIGETVGHRVDLHLQFALRMHAVDGLVVDHAAVVGEEGAVLSGDIDQRRRESVRTRTVVAALLETGPVGGLGPSCVTVTATAAVTGIDRTETTTVTILVGHLHVVIQTVACIETGGVCSGEPSCGLVVGHRRVVEARRCAGRERIASRDADVVHIQLVALVTGRQPQNSRK